MVVHTGSRHYPRRLACLAHFDRQVLSSLTRLRVKRDCFGVLGSGRCTVDSDPHLVLDRFGERVRIQDGVPGTERHRRVQAALWPGNATLVTVIRSIGLRSVDDADAKPVGKVIYVSTPKTTGRGKDIVVRLQPTARR